MGLEIHRWLLANWHDLTNAALELAGGVLLFLNVRAAWKAWEIKGVHWGPFLFYTVWGGWNVYYYPAVGQGFSGIAAIFPLAANIAFLGLWAAISLSRAHERAIRVLHPGDFEDRIETVRGQDVR